ncbi:MAG: CapA family protein [Lachnospiraceae bacterium]|nr:CapA family protein [Lachnospiraceae bacterium]
MRGKKRRRYRDLCAGVAVSFMLAVTGCGMDQEIRLSDDFGQPVISHNKITVVSEIKEEVSEDSLSIDQIEIENEPVKNDISVVMVGDILLHDPVNKVCHLEGGGYDYSNLFANTVDEIEAADLAIVNQEVIIGGESLRITGYPAFNAPFEIGDELVNAGFDVICHATNHAMDRGGSGIRKCLEFWEENHPEEAVLGIHDSEEDKNEIYVYEKDGIKIAILNYTYGTNGIRLPENMPFAVDLLDEERVCADIKRAEEMADFTIVCPHWGTEYSHDVSTEQDKWTEIFLKNGVDLVIGTHPHVIEPVEMRVNEDTGDEMLVYYSLGNFVNWTAGEGKGTSDRMVGGMARIELTRGDDGGVRIEDYGVRALVCHVSRERDQMSVYRLSDYTEELARSNEILDQDGSFSKEYCTELCNLIWGDTWD